jgi:hypothetical protein
MPKPKPQRESVFGDEGEESPSIPFIPASGVNEIYEKGFAGLPSSVYEDPSQKRIDELEEQLSGIMQQLEGRASDLVAQDGTLLVHGFQLSPTGLIAPQDYSEEAWDQIGQLLFRLEGSIQWLIGDWIVYGGAVGWGDIPALATKIGREPQTLRDYSYVSRRIKLSFRNDNLTYTHHVVAAKADLSPEELDYALKGAAHFGFSVLDFRKWIKQGMPQDGLQEIQELPEKTGPRYNPTKMLDSAFELTRNQDMMKVPIGELRRVRDDFAALRKIIDAEDARVAEVLEKREKKSK